MQSDGMGSLKLLLTVGLRNSLTCANISTGGSASVGASGKSEG